MTATARRGHGEGSVYRDAANGTWVGAISPVGLVGRRTQVNLDLARAYAMTRKDAAAVNLLLAAERLSPQLVRYDPATHDVLSELLRRENRPSTPELRPLARRAGVI